ncbi:tail fiber protein [Polaribacter haliotis]|uniref:Tail fiber protein n=1 Tax=Polaribacter haliotis TaxID=1888915 RepID=A0A7L8AE64_9FLAO|nr:phage tail protein [Polaribacter haliotis]QOD60282.1 tail fiber protein [Polaribacter haliotis]
MKSLKITFILLFISLASFAQSGMVFQGIARDNNSAAIVDKTMIFTFRITLTDGTDLYKETQQIRTDNFGVFSHVIGTGNAVTGTFGGVDFSQGNLKSIITVSNEGTDTQIYDQKFEYVPYAKRAESATSADNGVPVGTIITMLAGAIPEGYIECNGQSLADPKFAKLKLALGGMTNIPNLGGMYLKGSGAPNNGNYTHEIGLGAYQEPSTQSHTHVYGANHETNETGNHVHGVRFANTENNDSGGQGYAANNNHQSFRSSDRTGGASQWYYDNNHAQRMVETKGNHKHTVNVSGRTGHGGILGTGQRDGNIEKENRPYSFGVRYLIKY